MRDPREAAAAEAARDGTGAGGRGRSPAPAPHTAETSVVLLTLRAAHVLVPLLASHSETPAAIPSGCSEM